MEIRDYHPNDENACMLIMQGNIPEYFRENDLTDFSAFLKNLPGPFFVVTDSHNDVIACGGIAFGITTATEAILCYGMVAHTHLHQGIGLQLLKKRLDYFLPLAPQVERILVHTTQKTEGFFSKFGFSIVARERDGFGTGLDHVSMMVAKDVVLRLLNQSNSN